MRFARLWAQWENALAAIASDGAHYESPSEYARAFSRLENHYFVNAGFLESDGWIMANRGRIEHIPAVIVQGRYDIICPPRSAWDLAQAWPEARLEMVIAGHSANEAATTDALVRATDAFADRS